MTRRIELAEGDKYAQMYTKDITVWYDMKTFDSKGNMTPHSYETFVVADCDKSRFDDVVDIARAIECSLAGEIVDRLFELQRVGWLCSKNVRVSFAVYDDGLAGYIMCNIYDDFEVEHEPTNPVLFINGYKVCEVFDRA